MTIPKQAYQKNDQSLDFPPRGLSGSLMHSFSQDSSSQSSGASPGKTHRRNKKRKQNKKKMDPFAKMGKLVGLDCEMVGIGPGGQISSLARVVLVDRKGRVLLDEYIQQEKPVSDYRTFVSGITPEVLEKAEMTLDVVRKYVNYLIKDKILVGHGLKSDLHALQIQHPWFMIRDTAKYEPFMQYRFNDGVLWPRRLRDLVMENLGKEIQKAGKPHCPYEDAWSAIELYMMYRISWEPAMEQRLQRAREFEMMQRSQVVGYYQQPMGNHFQALPCYSHSPQTTY